ncbi:hypothetical protein R3W88_033578 [Solanum pinnatisectum]|uniref:DUF1985 domain-containing protein n=1 Tax=Solanum pinnatisectum TaxID=50273 RepID=A0AAV9K0K9_9SOLN|nr:hypothetical protein R3W88_033578 [Solanum pinnatisectum]
MLWKIFFRNSCFGQYLDLLEKNNARFQMTMKDEVLINYCGMPLFFGKKEFSIVTWLRCYSSSEPIPVFTAKKQPQRQKKGGEAETSKEQSTEEQDLVSLVGPSFKNPKLVALLNDKDTSRNDKESLCLLWFAWAFEPISHLRHQVTAKEEISSPRILRWLKAKNVKNPLDLFNPFDDALSCYITNFKFSYVVHPWLVPTEKELPMPSLITLGLIETLFDPVVDIVKRELFGATTIKRARVDDQLVVFSEDMFDVAVRAGVNIGIGVDVGDNIGVGVSFGGQSVGATSCS